MTVCKSCGVGPEDECNDECNIFILTNMIEATEQKIVLLTEILKDYHSESEIT